MIVSESASVLQASFSDLWFTVVSYVPAILAAAVIFVLGWIVAVVLFRIVVQVTDALKIDEALKSTGLHDGVKAAGFNLHVGYFLGELVKWFVVIGSLVAALDVLGLQQVNAFLQTAVLQYIPQVIVATLMIIVAAIVAEIVRNVVAGSARAAGVSAANFAGAVAKWAIWIFGVGAALTQLGVAAVLLQTLFLGVVFGFSLAFGLAFGLGGKEAAARFIEKVRSEIAHH
ncbi:hypothetical protein EBR66_00275 [bacterium]|nr:hypothetical protein [bacterium]